jgi:DNA polymerase-3 subunit epsilon
VTGWHHGRLAAFDTESTGVDVHTDRIVSAHVGLVGGGKATVSHSWLVNPGIPIPEAATKVHGITDERAAHGRPAPEAIDLIAGEVCLALVRDIPVVGWNAAFDLSLLDAECARYGLPTLQDRLGRPPSPVICGLVLDKHVDPYRKGSRKLVDVAVHYGVELLAADAHGAAADAMAAVRTVWHIANRHPDVAAMTLADLHTAQQQWAEEQAASLETYLRRSLPTAVVERGWPLRHIPAAVPQ